MICNRMHTPSAPLFSTVLVCFTLHAYRTLFTIYIYYMHALCY